VVEPPVAKQEWEKWEVQLDQKTIEKNFNTLLEIRSKYFIEPWQKEKERVEPHPREDALTTLRILSETSSMNYLSRFYAVRILGKTAQPEALAIIIQYFDDPQPDMKVAALHAIGDYIEGTNDYSSVPLLINGLVFNIAYYADRFEGGLPKGKLYPKNYPNCGLRIIVVNEEAREVLKRILNIEIPLNQEQNQKASAIVEARADADRELEKKASNFRLLAQLRDQYMRWWEQEGKEKFQPTRSDE
jgi:hypothetical protein